MTILYDDITSSEETLINVRAYGAQANGSDDSNAVLNALHAALLSSRPLYFPAGTYTLSTWTAPNLSGALSIRGSNASLVGAALNSADFLNLAGNSTVTLEGLGFANWKFVVFTSGNFNTSPINKIAIDKCSFSGVTCGIATATTSSAVGAVNINEVRVTNSKFNHIARAGVDLNSSGAVINVWIDNNDFTHVTANNVAGRKHAINVQGNYQTINGTYSTARFISNNRVSGVSNNTTDDCIGIQAEGYFCKVTNNHLRNVTKVSGESSNNDGIYVKSAYCVVAGNTLLNCAQSQAAINVKGSNRADLNENFGYAAIVTHNNILNTDASGFLRHCGIDVFTEDSLITNNMIEGVATGIKFETTSQNSTAKNNTVRRLDAPSGSLIGIQVGAPGITCTNNTIQDIGVSGVNTLQVRGILITSTTDLRDLDLSNNRIINLNSTTANARRAFYCSLGATGVVLSSKMIDNYIKNSDTGFRFNLAGQMGGINISNNKFDSVTTPIFYDSGVPISGSYVFMNPGATSNLQVTGSRGSNVALTSLLTNLSNVGLIDNQSSS